MLTNTKIMEIQEETENSKSHNKSGEKKNLFSLLTPKASVELLDNHYTLRQGLDKMRYYGYTAIPVISDNGEYIGTVSEGDFLRHIIENNMYSMDLQEESLISEIVREGWNPAVKIDTTMDELLLCVMEQNFVPVIDDRDKFVGIVTRKDVLKYYYSILK
jgi:predicted transcriptional regulator